MKRSLALVAVLGLVTMAQAQTTPTHTPPSPAAMAQHQVQRYTTLLTLTPTQVEQATTYFTAEATAHQNARASEHTAHQALADQLSDLHVVEAHVVLGAAAQSETVVVDHVDAV